MRELISVTFMILCLFGALEDVERSNSACVHLRLKEQINICVYTRIQTDAQKHIPMHALIHPLVRTHRCTQLHNAASHTHMHAA